MNWWHIAHECVVYLPNVSVYDPMWHWPDLRSVLLLVYTDIRTLVEITPHFGEITSKTLTAQNSTIYSSKYSLNKYFDKELFWVIS